MTPQEDYKQLLNTALALADRNASELVQLKLAVKRAIWLLRYGKMVKAQELLEKAMDESEGRNR